METLSGRTVWFGVACASAVCVTALPAGASDYAHSCRSADGLYEMNDGALYLSGSDASSGGEIAYTKGTEKILKQETGYCTTRTGNRYDYEYKSYVLSITFKHQGNPVAVDMICELAADGLPAAEVCDKTVVISKSGAGEDAARNAPSGSRGWTHNGSVLTLLANGYIRRFVYEVPREGLASAGIRAGDTVFRGTRDGSTYRGTAYIFRSGCKPAGYAVSGTVSPDDRTVTLTGKRPIVGKSCRPEGFKDDVLVFEYSEPDRPDEDGD